jgi:hypothetical protein
MKFPKALPAAVFMTRTLRATLLALGVLALAPLAAAQDQSAARQRVDETCPKIVILGDANHATRFAGEGRDVTDILYKTKLDSVDGGCKHKGANGITIDITAQVSAELGLAAKSSTLEVPLFIAIIDPEELVVTKQEATATIKFERGSRKGQGIAEFKSVKLALSEDTVGEDLEVVVGLQLDKDQLNYIRGGH